MNPLSNTELLQRIQQLEEQLEESEHLIDAIRNHEVDAFAIGSDSEIYTLQSGDYAYRVLIEQFGEGAVNVTEDGMIVYTNACFFELLDLEYEQVISAQMSDFIHPDSEDQFKELFNEGLTGKAKGEINLLANGKIIPVYISLTSLQPKLPTVGMIITDLTAKKKNEEVIHKYQKDLEIKNIELMQSNAELASFAYVASHDLQEPLRKIQIFSKRIMEKEADNLTANGQDYFGRLISATKRMQNLIIDLLNYSRINTSPVVYEPTDLNLVLDDVKVDLVELIDETDAHIEASILPKLNVIPHHFNQLLSNLISNAIKFRKEGQKPLVRITSDIVAAEDIKLQAVYVSKKYWRIQVIDNGIGFEQQYAERIFELFQRLHGRSEYEGTGIGLAICKKILQTHDGFITATGIPDEGTTINMYLPVRD